MPGVTEEQIIAARQMTAIEFLQRYRPEELVKVGSRGEFQLRAHDSFKINGETSNFHWKSRDVGGKSALDYLVKVEEMRFVDPARRHPADYPGIQAAGIRCTHNRPALRFGRLEGLGEKPHDQSEIQQYG